MVSARDQFADCDWGAISVATPEEAILSSVCEGSPVMTKKWSEYMIALLNFERGRLSVSMKKFRGIQNHNHINKVFGRSTHFF
jgi:hypothetical protein